MAGDKKKGLEMIVALGGGKPSPAMKDDPKDVGEQSDNEDLPEEFVSSLKDYENSKDPKDLWYAIKACQGSYKTSESGKD